MLRHPETTQKSPSDGFWGVGGIGCRRGGRGVAGGHGAGVGGEEVAAENLAQSPEQGGVDAGAREDVVDVAAVAVDCARKPCHATSLTKHFATDGFTYGKWLSVC